MAQELDLCHLPWKTALDSGCEIQFVPALTVVGICEIKQWKYLSASQI